MITEACPFCFQMWLTWSESTQHELCSYSDGGRGRARLSDWLIRCLICIRRSGINTELSVFKRTYFLLRNTNQRLALKRCFSPRCRWQWKRTLSVRTTATRRSAALEWIRRSQQVLSIWSKKCSMFLSVSGMRPFKCSTKVSQFLILKMFFFKCM